MQMLSSSDPGVEVFVDGGIISKDSELSVLHQNDTQLSYNDLGIWAGVLR